MVTNSNSAPANTNAEFTTSKDFTRSCGKSYYAYAIAEDSLGNRSAVKSLGSTSDGANSYNGWSACSKSCGTGSQTRTNNCALVTTGLSQSCNTQTCCSKTTYKDTNGKWGTCSKTCGGGTQNYTVTRTYYSAYDGSYCSQSTGVVTSSQACNTGSCCTFTSKDFGYTGGMQSWTVPSGCAGTYQLEVWGAQGGSYQSAGGKGGYSKGNKALSAGTVLYIGVGGQGSTFNGGGLGSSNTANGGGGTHIGLTNSQISGTAVAKLLIVAGGGGAGGSNSSWSPNAEVGSKNWLGGAGGGTNGSAGTSMYVAGANYYSGAGGTQSAGGKGAYVSSMPSHELNGGNGSYGQGGYGPVLDGNRYGAGGGGGFYGGGAGGYLNAILAGGGGSGYIGGVTGGSMTAGQRAGHGYARITKIN